MGLDAREVADLIGAFYAAVPDPSALEHALGLLVGATGAAKAMVVDAGGDGAKRIRAASGVDPEAVAAYNDHFHLYDLAVPVPEGGPVLFSRDVAERVWPGFETSEFRIGWSLPNRMEEIALVSVGGRAGASRSLVLAARPGDAEFGGPEQLALLGLLGPHLARMTELAARLRSAETAELRFREMLERLPCGAILLDARGRPVHATAAALASLRMDGALTVTARGLRAFDREADRKLRAAVSAALGPRDTASAGAVPRPIAIPRPTLPQPLVAHVLAMAEAEPATGEEGAALVLLGDPSRLPALPAGVLAEAFRLTRMEALVALRVADGIGIGAVADELGILPSTARTHLQRVFDKTGTHRQAELGRLVAGLGAAAPIRREADRRNSVSADHRAYGAGDHGERRDAGQPPCREPQEPAAHQW